MQRITSLQRITSHQRVTSHRAARALVLAIVVACLSLALPVAHAQVFEDENLSGQGLVRLDDVEAGSLLFESDEPGWYVPAPTLRTKIEVDVTGPIARTTVSQRFHNEASVFVEGKYVFPLPEGSAVDSLRMRVGDRWIEGEIEEAKQAEIIYQEAKEAGQVASLVEQLRPNVFSTSVANIAPDTDVIIQVEYQETLEPRDGSFGLRIPLVVAPRYSPAGDSGRLQLGSSGWMSESVDASGKRILTPVVDPRTEAPGTIRNPVEISIDLDAGFPLGPVLSPYHDVDVDRRIENGANIEVTTSPADRDFYLSWTPIELTAPYAAAFTESRANETHYVTMLTPPDASAIADSKEPREVIFVQDTSGSMGGDSLAQAKAGLILALEQLGEGDTFNVIEFNTYHSSFATEPVKATPFNVNRAIDWVDALVSTGGTEMLPALEDALDDSDSTSGRLRQVIFLTDGAVSNELQMLQLIERDLGTSRLFTVGIGSAPNSYFMTAAARSGRGSFVFIGDLNEVSQQMQALFEKIESPAVVNLSVEGLPAGVTVSPSPIPDLYAGDPIALTVRVPPGESITQLSLVGRQDGHAWNLDVDLVAAEIRPGVSKLWAREHIRDLEALRLSPEVGQDEREAIDAQVLDTALDFGLVSRLTSLVAVDVEITRPADADSATTNVASNLPAGWDPEIFDGVGSSNDAAQLSGALLDRLAQADAARAAEQAQGDGSGLPFAATGADWQVRALFGSGLMIVGLVAYVATGERRRWA